MRKLIQYSDGEVDLSFIYRRKLHHGIYFTSKKSDINKNLILSEIKLDKKLNTMASKRGSNVVITYKDYTESFQFIVTEEYEIGSYRKATDIYNLVLCAENLLQINTVEDLLDSSILDEEETTNE